MSNKNILDVDSIVKLPQSQATKNLIDLGEKLSFTKKPGEHLQSIQPPPLNLPPDRKLSRRSSGDSAESGVEYVLASQLPGDEDEEEDDSYRRFNYIKSHGFIAYLPVLAKKLRYQYPRPTEDPWYYLKQQMPGLQDYKQIVCQSSYVGELRLVNPALHYISMKTEPTKESKTPRSPSKPKIQEFLDRELQERSVFVTNKSKFSRDNYRYYGYYEEPTVKHETLESDEDKYRCAPIYFQGKKINFCYDKTVYEKERRFDLLAKEHLKHNCQKLNQSEPIELDVLTKKVKFNNLQERSRTTKTETALAGGDSLKLNNHFEIDDSDLLVKEEWRDIVINSKNLDDYLTEKRFESMFNFGEDEDQSTAATYNRQLLKKIYELGIKKGYIELKKEDGDDIISDSLLDIVSDSKFDLLFSELQSKRDPGIRLRGNDRFSLGSLLIAEKESPPKAEVDRTFKMKLLVHRDFSEVPTEDIAALEKSGALYNDYLYDTPTNPLYITNNYPVKQKSEDLENIDFALFDKRPHPVNVLKPQGSKSAVSISSAPENILKEQKKIQKMKNINSGSEISLVHSALNKSKDFGEKLVPAAEPKRRKSNASNISRSTHFSQTFSRKTRRKSTQKTIRDPECYSAYISDGMKEFAKNYRLDLKDLTRVYKLESAQSNLKTEVRGKSIDRISKHKGSFLPLKTIKSEDQLYL